jgi:hypothetical protein
MNAHGKIDIVSGGRRSSKMFSPSRTGDGAAWLAS